MSLTLYIIIALWILLGIAYLICGLPLDDRYTETAHVLVETTFTMEQEGGAR